MSTTTPDAERRAVRSTYRSLRLGVVVLLLLLVTAVATEAARAGCWLDSLSAYYWTGAHDVVVGALCGLGALLVVYAGVDDVEDALLDLAGFCAFVVALTPTEVGAGCPGTVVAPPTVPSDVGTGLTALLVAALVAFGVRSAVALRAGLAPDAAVARGAGALVVVAVAAVHVTAPDLVVAAGHDAAAVLLFVCVIGVVVRHAFGARGGPGPWAAVYGALGAGMLVTLAAVVALDAVLPTWQHTVLVLETLLVGLFAAAWVAQTVELWGHGVVRSRRA